LTKFNKDFLKLSEYFFNSNSNDGKEKNYVSNKLDNNNLLYDNNYIELGQSSNDRELRLLPKSRAKLKTDMEKDGGGMIFK
jgi:hypothetical protein